MDWVTLTGVKPWDGRYRLDLGGQQLTVREWGWLADLTGYLPLTIDEGFEGGDPKLYAALAVIAVRRAGRLNGGDDVADMFDRLLDAPWPATIRLESDDDVEDGEQPADPPAGSSNGSGAISGPASTTSSASSPAIPPDSGTPASAISASGLATSAS